MYSSRGSNTYGQQSYGGQSGYGQNLGSGYTSSSVGGSDGSTQHPLGSRHSSLFGASQDTDVGGYRGHASPVGHYGGQYAGVYGSAAMSGAQLAPTISAKGSGSLALEGRGSYSSAATDSPKFASGGYVPSSSHGYAQKNDQLYSEKLPDYSLLERRQYGERQSTYLGRGIQNDPATRYSESVGFSRQHQLLPEIYDRIDQESMLRQEQLLKSRSIQSASLDGTGRQIDYLAARGGASHHPSKDLLSYGARIDAEPRTSSVLGGSSYIGHGPSILGAAPRKSVDDLLFPQNTSNPGYGVSLPPGRDYGSGKGLHGTSHESDYIGSHSRLDKHHDDRASYLRDFELREEERRRELLREREKDREREREREREHERERVRKRERERLLERREKERERERERIRALEIRRERTPLRASKDRRGSSVMKEGKSLRRDSPSREVSIRRRTPVKEKRREYVCKIQSSRLVDMERDYSSVDKRYPRLFISPEFCKVVINWPKENLKLSIHTPVSFEHDFVEDDGVAEVTAPTRQFVKPEHGTTVWNAKVILMSGLSRNALEDLSSAKISEDRVPHICNILRFAILRKNNTFMAVGGPWDSADGGDPSIDDSSLVRTALRYAKEVIQLDLQKCQNWNRFLEIHYDRFGEDGFFSHKEVTVLFVPDLSECLPSLDAWRDQWLAHRKAVTDREHQLFLKKEMSKEKGGNKDKRTASSKDSKGLEKPEKMKDSPSSANNKKEKDGNDVKGKVTAQKVDEDVKKLSNEEAETGEEHKNVEKDQEETASVSVGGSGKPGKKKIIRRIVKQKVADKASKAEHSASKQTESMNAEAVEGKNERPEITVEQSGSSGDRSEVKTYAREKVTKKDPEEKTSQTEGKGAEVVVRAEKEVDSTEDKPKDISGTSTKGTSVKTTIKKKIIKRVLKRKLGIVTGKDTNETKENKVALAGEETGNTVQRTDDGEKKASEVKNFEDDVKLKSPIVEKQDDVLNPDTKDVKVAYEDKMHKRETDGKTEAVAKVESKADKQEVPQKDNYDGKRGKAKEEEKSKDEKDKDRKEESKGKSSKEAKEKRKPEEPPRHPGLILQTKSNNLTKLHSLSLSLDSLLEYTDKDIDESTFELSLFAESLYEMLQYQMGCRLLSFLQKLRIKFVTRRNQRKRQREGMDDNDKDKDKKSSTKRPKTSEPCVKTKPDSSEVHADDKKATTEDKELTKREENSVDHVSKAKVEVESEEEEDPEEEPEEDEEMEDPEEYEETDDRSHDLSNENEKGGDASVNAEQEAVNSDGKVEVKEAAKEDNNLKDSQKNPKSEADLSQKKDTEMETEKKEPSGRKEDVVDKGLLEAFRFFDRNLAGYIRVEDMRLIIHNLGKFLSHRDVKELVQSALLESNTGRDDRILYHKLVRMTGI